MKNPIHWVDPLYWFEILVADMDRAVRFHQTTPGIELRRGEFTGKPMAIFSGPRKSTGGAPHCGAISRTETMATSRS
jgi:predicted enzyme related to lactoylglutathione lyase